MKVNTSCHSPSGTRISHHQIRMQLIYSSIITRQVNETLPITIKIKPQVKIEVLEAVPENLNVGSEGYLNLKIKNTGFEDGKKASVKDCP